MHNPPFAKKPCSLKTAHAPARRAGRRQGAAAKANLLHGNYKIHRIVRNAAPASAGHA